MSDTTKGLVSLPCDRTYDKGSYMARVKNGTAYCPSCGQPIKEHGYQDATTEVKKIKEDKS